MRKFLDGLCGKACDSGSSIEGPWIDGFSVLVEAGRGMFDELTVVEACGDDFAADGVRQSDVRPDVEAEPKIGELGGRAASGVDNDQLCAIVYPFEKMMEEDRVRVARVGPPQDDEIGLLSFLVRTRSPTCSEYCRQTDDAWSVSSTVARVDRVGTYGHTDELLGEVVHLIGAFGTTHHPERARPVAASDITDAPGRPVERLIPRCWAEDTAVPHERTSESISMHAHLLRPGA